MITPYSRTHALIVGISRYRNPQYWIEYARKDAEAFEKLLKEEFGFPSVVALYDEQATAEAIDSALKRTLLTAGPDDGVVVFFACHGVSVTSAMGQDEGFLVPYDGDREGIARNLHMALIRDSYLKISPALHILVIVDACHSGLALRDIQGTDAQGDVTEAVLRQSMERRGRQILTAGGRDERVLDGGGHGHSVFAHRLMEALSENRPYITADRVGLWVKDKVPWDAQEQRQRQTPQFGNLFNTEGTFIFHRRSGTASPRPGRAPTPQFQPQPTPQAPSEHPSTSSPPVVPARKWAPRWWRLGGGGVAALAAWAVLHNSPQLSFSSDQPDFGKPWTNTFGQAFLPGIATNLLFARCETSVGDYLAFVEATGRAWTRPTFPQPPQHPAVNVSWEDLQAYCVWLSDQERAAHRLGPNDRYRLPTDREWSLAVGLRDEAGVTPRARDMGIPGRFPWGTSWPPPRGAGNYSSALHVDPAEFTAPTGSETNSFDLRDLGGNVREWVVDWYDESHQFRVLRGASWRSSNPDYLLSSYRGNEDPTNRADDIGFRLVLVRGGL